MWQVHLQASDANVYPIVLIAFGMIAGFFGGLLGLGGGWLVTPLLNIMGLPAAYCVGTSMAQMVGTSAIAVLKHMSRGHLHVTLGLMFGFPVIGGVYLGKQLLTYLHAIGFADSSLRLMFLILLVAMGTSILREVYRTKPSQPAKRSRTLPAIGPSVTLSDIGTLPVYIPLLVGLSTGVLSGLMGVGGGVFLLPVLIYIVKLPQTVAVATSLISVLMGSCIGSFIYSQSGYVEWQAAGMILLGSVIGSFWGASMTQYATGTRLKLLFALLLLSTSTSIALKALAQDLLASGVLFGSSVFLWVFALVSLRRERSFILQREA